MPKITLADALKALQSRNDALISAYREGAKALSPGPVPNLASSMAEQRKELGKALATLASSAGRSEIDLDPPALEGAASPPAGAKDPASLLRLMYDAEDAEFERLTELAGSVLAVSAQAAELLASEANAAKKRASWARDHLDLMGLIKP
jgi:hypothetical protein